ncbi:MAG: chorismate-binding protein, partial [Gammaproteobacteria bacterium]|nr:chorismate-binding protein [Gammaproteobacteria bacterium]
MDARSLQVREVAATPAQLRALVARHPGLFPALFDSTAVGPLGRYSILVAAPGASLLLRGDGKLEARGVATRNKDFLGALDEWWSSARTEPADTDATGELPFRGGWLVYLGYELADHIETGLHLPALRADAVCALAQRVTAALVHDHLVGRTRLVAAGTAAETIAAIEAALAALGPAGAAAAPAAPPMSPIDATLRVAEQPPASFRDAVLRAQQYIAAGDVYQANLSRGWQLELASPADAGALFESLRRANPAPFAAHASLPGMRLLSSSPERLVRVCGRCVETRPIAGTRARHGTPGSDAT